MDNEQTDYSGYSQQGADSLTKIRDMEEKQRMLHERTLLIGKNMIENKEKTDEKIIEIKKELEQLRIKMERMVSFIETLSGELSGFARKEDVEILSKQAKIFQPLAGLKK